MAVTVTLTSQSLPATADTLVLFAFKDEVKEALAFLRDVDDCVAHLDEETFSGKLRQCRMLYPKSLGCKRLLVIGIGPRDGATLESVRRGFGHGIRLSVMRGITEMAVCSQVLDGVFSWDGIVKAIAETAVLASYRVDATKLEPRKVLLERVGIVVPDTNAHEDALRFGVVGALHTRHARTLVNTSPSVATPKYMADYCKEHAPANVTVDIFDDAKLREHKMGGILAVGRGSINRSRLVVLEYKPEGATKTVALVGKGVTFDSGGLSLKPSSGMETMKCDKAGACAVLATVFAAAELKLPVHVYGMCGFAENMPGQDAYKLGDFVKTASGKSIEILNTDAEGRVVLADALHYATTKNPDVIIDLATLTGACVRALGSSLAGVMGTDQGVIDGLREAGDRSGERLWQLPLEKDYEGLLDSRFADIKNVPGSGRKGPGAITAGFFLKAFVGDSNWAHLDIAGPAWTSEDLAKGYLSYGGSGFGVRLLLEYLKNLT